MCHIYDNYIKKMVMKKYKTKETKSYKTKVSKEKYTVKSPTIVRPDGNRKVLRYGDILTDEDYQFIVDNKLKHLLFKLN